MRMDFSFHDNAFLFLFLFLISNPNIIMNEKFPIPIPYSHIPNTLLELIVKPSSEEQ